MAKNKRNYPKMLTNVLKAISGLKESRGSSMNKIVDLVSTGYGMDPKKSDKPRNVTMQVRKALRHGIQTGLIVQQGGKYKIAIEDAGVDPKNLPIKEVRRRRRGRKGGKGRKGRRGRGRRRGRRGGRRRGRKSSSFSSVSETEISDANTDASDSDASGQKVVKRRRKAADYGSGSKRKRTTEDTKSYSLKLRKLRAWPLDGARARRNNLY